VTAQRAGRRNEPPHQNIHQTSTRDISIDMTLIDAALAAIKLLKLGEQFSYRKIAAEYYYNRTTLARRYQGILALQDV
jgi:AraC-like DNA-binding protein